MSFLVNGVTLKDGPQLDAFGNLKVSQPNNAFDAQQEYGLDLIHTWAITANGTLPTIETSDGSVSSGGNSVGPANANTGLTPIVVSATNGHYAVLQSKQFIRYIPKHGHELAITGIFAAGANATVSAVLRTETSGAPVDTPFLQSAWNQDTFSATAPNPSGITLDFTKTQHLVIDTQMLYVGRIRVGFVVGGILRWAHYIDTANSQIVPTVRTYNLPVRMEGRTGASTTVFRTGLFASGNGVFLETSRTTLGGTCQFECCAVQTYGAVEARGFPRAAGNGTTARGVTTRQPVFSIRPRALYNGRTNRGHIEFLRSLIYTTTNDASLELVLGGTLTGAIWTPVGIPITAGSFIVGARYVIVTTGTTDFTLIGAASNTIGLEFVATGAGAGTGTAVKSNSIVDFDASATAISGGVRVGQGYATSGFGVVSSIEGVDTDLRGPLVLSQIDALTATQTPLSLVATSFSGTSNLSVAMEWHEQVI